MVAGADGASMQTRASRLVAEALVERQEPSQIVESAERLGLPKGLTSAVVAACCGNSKACTTSDTERHDDRVVRLFPSD